MIDFEIYLEVYSDILKCIRQVTDDQIENIFGHALLYLRVYLKNHWSIWECIWNYSWRFENKFGFIDDQFDNMFEILFG